MKIVLEIKSGVLCQVTSDKMVEVVLIDHDVGEKELWQAIQIKPGYIKKVFRKVKSYERR